ncbi:MAG: hypothetical protein HWE08_12145 [Alphaproteobacteria bacterium]|nr:hypothetical protein [Alphaproteobacteria bacterium]
MSATSSKLAAGDQMLVRKPLRRYVGIVLLIGLAGFLFWVYPVEKLMRGDWDNWPHVAFLFVAILPIMFVQVLRALLIHIFFENILVSESGVYRIGLGGKWRVVDGSAISSVDWKDKGLFIYVVGGRKYFFPATHYEAE